MQVVDDLGVPALASGVQARQRQPFESDHISVTELLDSPRIRLLKRKHWNDLRVPLSEQMWSFLGTSTHAMLEAAVHGENALVEKRLSIQRGDRKLSGQLDLYEDGVLSDFKITSVWSVILSGSDRIEHWTQQLNIYAELLRHHGHQVAKARIIAILRDWSPSKALGNEDYPKSKVVVLNIELWTPERVLALIDARLVAHRAAEAMLPECSSSERWSDSDTYAVMQAGRKSALRVLDSEQEAQRWLLNQRQVGKVVKRVGRNRRCGHYCPVSEVCEQWKNMKS